jgi:hypothetical protein
MNLLQIINAYQWSLQHNDRAVANKWLKSIGLHVTVQKAIRDCFDDSGKEI